MSFKSIPVSALNVVTKMVAEIESTGAMAISFVHLGGCKFAFFVIATDAVSNGHVHNYYVGEPHETLGGYIFQNISGDEYYDLGA